MENTNSVPTYVDIDKETVKTEPASGNYHPDLIESMYPSILKEKFFDVSNCRSVEKNGNRYHITMNDGSIVDFEDTAGDADISVKFYMDPALLKSAAASVTALGRDDTKKAIEFLNSYKPWLRPGGDSQLSSSGGLHPANEPSPTKFSSDQDNVCLIMNYSPVSHLLIGKDLKDKYEKFRVDVL